ncbi:hypothetical protein JCM30197_21810 [Schleiferia thermophila]|jgi:hypothetical protein|nr:hypothetical protein CEN47_14820 [Fischerella thermalis CCMEE 5319]GCD80934.1 hypothetical protein JCM30197_21810 [Schleiferia thermophila]
MSGIMNFLTMIAMLYLFGSCNQPSSSSETQHSNKEEMKQEIQIEADSIVVNYWKSTEANEYHFSYTKEKIEIRSAYFNFEKNVNEALIIQQFLRFINQLYIDKNEKIILSQEEEPAPVSDYHVISVLVYFNGKKIIEENTKIYSNIKFNSLFLEFYDFLDSLIREE